MDLSQVALQPVFATALISLVGGTARELSFEKGDLIQVRKDLGDGVVLGANVSQGSTTGVIRLRNIELNLQTQDLESTQLSVEELLLVRREYAEMRRKREEMQAEVASLREAKEEMVKSVNPVRYALRSLDDLLLHLVQTDIESIEVAELVREAQNEWTSIVADINRLQVSIDDPELDPFRRLVLDRCDGLKKRVASLVGPATETLTNCKLLHVDLENIANAFHGRALLPKPTRSAAEHARTASQGALATSSSHIVTAQMPFKGHQSSFSAGSQTSASVSSPALTRVAALHKPLGGSLSTLPDYVPPTSTQHVGSDFFAPQTQTQSDSLVRAHTATALGTHAASPMPKHLDRAALLGGQRTRGSSPSLIQNPASTSSSPPAVATLPPSVSASPGNVKFVFGTKPSSLKFEIDARASQKKDGPN